MEAGLNRVLHIPDLALVVLIGASGAGKSTFAARHFLPTEVVSSDFCRKLVSDNENDQSSTPDAFAVLDFIARSRLRFGRLAVIDATNVEPERRHRLVALAREHHCSAVAIVFNLPERTCIQRSAARPDRRLPARTVQGQVQQLRRGLARLEEDGFENVHVLDSEPSVDGVLVRRERLPVDRRHEAGPLDVIGDVHGCREQLIALLEKLGYEVGLAAGRWSIRHPQGRRIVFVGDLVDRGPDTPGVLRLVMAAAREGVALSTMGDHDWKLLREEPELVEGAKDFVGSLPSHYVFDAGRLVVAHAGLPAGMHGREAASVREFALHGQTIEEPGLSLPTDWTRHYRGTALVVYGHTPVAEPRWSNHTVNIDTGCVTGGKLTAFRYPERLFVSVPGAAAHDQPEQPA